jgi:serine phosphatase RsbU (regulator of sigma subunit)
VIKCSESASETMLEAIFTDVAQFAGEAPQSDDITVAVLEFIGEDNFSSIPL